jgi:hypothetical protein
LDLEAGDMAVRSAVHQVGAAALTEWLRFEAGDRPAEPSLLS